MCYSKLHEINVLACCVLLEALERHVTLWGQSMILFLTNGQEAPTTQTGFNKFAALKNWKFLSWDLIACRNIASVPKLDFIWATFVRWMVITNFLYCLSRLADQTANS